LSDGISLATSLACLEESNHDVESGHGSGKEKDRMNIAFVLHLLGLNIDNDGTVKGTAFGDEIQGFWDATTSRLVFYSKRCGVKCTESANDSRGLSDGISLATSLAFPENQAMTGKRTAIGNNPGGLLCRVGKTYPKVGEKSNEY
jgi:hypothetical protein